MPASQKAILFEGRPARSWLEGLDLDTPEKERKDSERAFREMGPAVIPWLISQFQNPKLSARQATRLEQAFGVLESLASQAVPQLAELVNLHDEPTFITHTLARIGPSSYAVLPTLLHHPKELVRVRTCEALADLINKRRAALELDGLVSEVLPMLEHPWHMIRWRAASLLGIIRLQPDASIPALIRLLDDRFPGVQSAGAFALSQFGDAARQAIPRIIELTKAKDQPLRAYAIQSLGYFSDESILPILIEGLNDKDIRTQAVYAIARLHWPAEKVVPVLTECLKSEHYILRWVAANALGNRGAAATGALPALREEVAESEPPLRALLLKSIARIEAAK